MKEENQFLHVVLTRFNVRTEFNSNSIPKQDWLEHRFQLFDQFAFPSMRFQKCRKFRWLVFLDKLTPRPFRERIEFYTSNCPNMMAVYVDSIRVGTPETAAVLRPLIEQHLTPKMTHLITTRFDNDDALSENFVSTIQQQFDFQEFEFINLPSGYLWHKNKLYTKRDLSNPFISLIESVSDFQTVWCSGHHLLDSLGPIRQVETNPQWIQVIHKRNVSNRVRVGNIRLPIKSLPTTFHLKMQANLENESERAIAFENEVKKKIRRFRWKWKQYRKRVLGMKQRV